MKLFSGIADWVGAGLKRKFILILASVLFLVSIAFLAIVVRLYQDQLIKEQARAAMQVNSLLQTSLENAMLKRDIDGLRDIVKKLGSQQGIAGVAILSPEFEVRFSSHEQTLGAIMTSPEIKAAHGTKEQQADFIFSPTGAELLRSVNPVRNREPCRECHGDPKANTINGLLIVDYDAASIRRDALHSAITLGGIGGLIIVVMGVSTWIALRTTVISRINLLRQANQDIARGRLDTRTRMPGTDEISQLGTSFDHMAAKLERTHRDLDQSSQFLQNVIDATPDGIRVIDNNHTIVKANQAYCDHVGVAMEHVVGAKCYASSHGRSSPCPHTLVSCPLVELHEEPGLSMKGRQRHVHKDGGELFVEVVAARANLFIDGKEMSCVIESIRDLAEQAKLSHEQRLSEIGLLATGVAHEIHNPLSSLHLALRAMQADLENTHDSQFDLGYLEIAETEIKKCLAITDGLMKLSDPPGENLQLIQVAGVISNVMALLSHQAQSLHIAVQISMDTSLRILADESDIRIVAVNLAQNAFHAMPEGGKLTITGERLGDQLIIKFSDTGVGIPRSNMNKIFLPFWSHRADAISGHGLGLSICKSSVARMGGTLSVDSQVGQGSCFTLTLPDADSDRDDHDHRI